MRRAHCLPPKVFGISWRAPNQSHTQPNSTLTLTGPGQLSAKRTKKQRISQKESAQPVKEFEVRRDRQWEPRKEEHAPWRPQRKKDVGKTFSAGMTNNVHGRIINQRKNTNKGRSQRERDPAGRWVAYQWVIGIFAKKLSYEEFLKARGKQRARDPKISGELFGVRQAGHNYGGGTPPRALSSLET